MILPRPLAIKVVEDLLRLDVLDSLVEAQRLQIGLLNKGMEASKKALENRDSTVKELHTALDKSNAINLKLEDKATQERRRYRKKQAETWVWRGLTFLGAGYLVYQTFK